MRKVFHRLINYQGPLISPWHIICYCVTCDHAYTNIVTEAITSLLYHINLANYLAKEVSLDVIRFSHHWHLSPNCVFPVGALAAAWMLRAKPKLPQMTRSWFLMVWGRHYWSHLDKV